MFNLLISYREDSWSDSPTEFERSRVAVEYTADEISERYKSLDESAIEELKGFPALLLLKTKRQSLELVASLRSDSARQQL